MTAPETIAPATARASGAAAASKRFLVFGTGLGIAVNGNRLDVAIVRSRSAGPRVIASTVIEDFRGRPAAEWGGELLRFLAAAQETNLTATLILPREEVIVRSVQLPGVAAKDLAAAVELQIESLHPYGDEEVAFAWSRAGSDTVLVGIVRRQILESYETLFSEAGIGLAAVTFSSAAVHAALRIWSAAPASVLCFCDNGRGRTEIYGESESRPVYSAEFSIGAERALAIARAELRLAPDYPARTLGEELPQALNTPESVSPLAYAAALDASAPLVTRLANLVPKERRASNTRKQYMAPALLLGILAISAVVAFVIIPAVQQHRYLNSLNAEIRRLEPAATRAQVLEKQINTGRQHIAALDDFRHRDQADLDVLNELTRILPPPTWTSSIEIYPDSVVIAGESDQAAPLLKVVDSSPLFQNSEFALSVTRNGAGQTEQFRIKTMRRGRIGRTTP